MTFEKSHTEAGKTEYNVIWKRQFLSKLDEIMDLELQLFSFNENLFIQSF